MRAGNRIGDLYSTRRHVDRPPLPTAGVYKLKTIARLLDLDEDIQTSLKACAEETTIPARSLVSMAVAAVIEAIERSNYRIVVPLEFVAIRVPERREAHEENEALVEIEPGMRVTFSDDVRNTR